MIDMNVIRESIKERAYNGDASDELLDNFIKRAIEYQINKFEGLRKREKEMALYRELSK